MAHELRVPQGSLNPQVSDWNEQEAKQQSRSRAHYDARRRPLRTPRDSTPNLQAHGHLQNLSRVRRDLKVGVVDTVRLIAPGFGGINLEDISAPRCFEIERRLREELDIPVFHDDQHGTAIVTLAPLLNALKVVGRSRRTCGWS